MSVRSPAIHDTVATARPSSVRSGAFYAVRRALSEGAFLLVGVGDPDLDAARPSTTW